MSKLAIDQNKISRCQYCNNLMYWTVRRENVNSTLTDKDVQTIAHNGLGEKMNEWCETCNHYTLQIVVAFDLAREES